MSRLSNLVPATARLPRRVVQLFTGLALYGVSMAFMVESDLGLNPWDVFHQGVSKATGISFGWVVLLTGVPVLLLWIPLRQRPGFGTIANLVVIGFVADGALAVLAPGEALPMRITYLVVGIALNGVATAMYIGARFGPGPRDGLMTGIVRRWPRMSIRLVRTSIEVLVLGIGFLYKRYTSKPDGRLRVDRILLHIPVLGDVLRKSAVSRFTRTLGTLVSSGVSILDGLEITAKTAGNRVVQDAIMESRASIAGGDTIAQPLKKSGVFPPMVISMISVGEQTGGLDEMLTKIADFYDDEVDAAVGNLLSLLEPLMIVFLGVVVGGMVVAMYLPIFDMINAVQ